MKPINAESGIIPLNEFKSRAGRWFERVREDDAPLVVTQNGRPAGVVISPAAYDEWMRRTRLLDELVAAEVDMDAGNSYSSEQVMAELRRRQKERLG